MTPDEFIRQQVERRIREQTRKLEEQGKLFLRMGYTLDELTIVHHHDGTAEVSPNSALPEGMMGI